MSSGSSRRSRERASAKRAKPVTAKTQAQPASVRRAKLRPGAPEEPGLPQIDAGGDLHTRQVARRLDAERAHGRLEDLYEISKLFARFESVHETFDAALALVAKTQALRSAILVEVENGQSRMIVWSSRAEDPAQLHAAKEHVQAACTYLVGGESLEYLELTEQAGVTLLPGGPDPGPTVANPFIVLPLVVAKRPPFGVLQLEGSVPFDRADLMFVNAIANQLSIALDRDRAWRRDIARRKRAEQDTADAEARGVMSERGRAVAESSMARFEALATDNAVLYERAQRAVRAREQILSIVSHDLKNPLAAILLTAGTLAKSSPAVERRRGLPQAVGIIHRSANRMLRLIDDLLDFASIEAGHLAVKRQSENPGALLQETVASFATAAETKHLRLTAELEPNLPPISCDRDRILQVLSNLVGNATKATSAGGSIILRLENRGRDLLFSVADDGPGISEEDAKHLFERYWRSQEARYSGTGLGLAIARGIVSAHGGRIWVDSVLGHGAKFSFTIPLVESANAQAAGATSGPDLRSN